MKKVADANEITERFKEMWKSFGHMTPEWKDMMGSPDSDKDFWEGVVKTNQANMDALKELNDRVASSFKSIGERQWSLFETMVNETETASKEIRAAGEHAPEAAKEAFQRMLAGMREIAAIAEKANKDALAEIEKRGETLKAEIKEMVAKARA